MTMTSAWAPIFKSVDQDDGTIFVYGKATDDSLDRDHQRCDPNWLNEAMPEWFRTGANIREQHDGKRAVGVGVAHDIGPDGHYIKAHIVDPISVLKVKTGVLKGYSIGISNPKVSKSESAPNGLIDGGSICELSICDRPSNPGCQLTLAKAAKPGMKNLRPSDFDSQRMLVKCEELTEVPKSDGPELTVTIGERLSSEAAKKLDSVASEEKADIRKATDADDLSAPAPGQRCGDGGEPVDSDEFDRNAAKALVLSTVEKADSGLGQDESGDISGALQAISIIAQLIQSEAKDLGDTPAQGCDIDLLMQAVQALRIFNCREAKEQAGIDPGSAPILLSAEPDMAKAKYTADELRQMLKDGKAFKNPNGEPSYPIGDKDDLSNAIAAVGRGSGDHDAIRAYIKKRAAALGCSNMIPDNWTSSGSNGSSKSVEPVKEKTVEVEETTDPAVQTVSVDDTREGGVEKATGEDEVAAVTEDDVTPSVEALVEKVVDQRIRVLIEEFGGEAVSQDVLEKSLSSGVTATALGLQQFIAFLAGSVTTESSPLHKSVTTVARVDSTQKSFSDLTERVDRVEQMATPGGPQLRRTEVERVQSRKSDLEREVMRYKALARNEDDHMLREGWLQKAALHQAELKSL